jgi:hypothetical protein
MVQTMNPILLASHVIAIDIYYLKHSHMISNIHHVLAQ